MIDRRGRRPGAQGRAVAGLLLGTFVSMFAVSVFSTSLPVIVADLAGNQASYTWIVTVYLLTTAVGTPVWGKLADLVDPKALFQLSMVVFILATTLAGLSSSPEMLITLRAVQGIGGGGLAALGQVILADLISPRDRGRFLGLFSMVTAVAIIGGPLLGGVITDLVGWRWNFVVSIPFAVAAFVLIQGSLTLSPRPPRAVRVDVAGILLLTTAVTLVLVWSAEAGQSIEWAGPESALLLSGAVVAGVAFVLVERRVPEPLIPIALFRDPTFALTVTGSLATGIGLFGTVVFLSQYLQFSRGATPAEAGVLTMPMMLGLLLASTVAGMVTTRTGRWKGVLVAGAAAIVVGGVLLASIDRETSVAVLIASMAILGAGVGITMQIHVIIVQNAAPAADIGAASAGVAFFRSLGGAIGVAVMGGVVATRVGQLVRAAAAGLDVGSGSSDPQTDATLAQLLAGTFPVLESLPDGLRTLVEEVYAVAIASAFLVVVPIGLIGLLATILLPRRELSRQTTGERLASELVELDGGVPIVVQVIDPRGADEVTPTAGGADERPGIWRRIVRRVKRKP